MITVHVHTVDHFINTLQEEGLVNVVRQPSLTFARVEKFENPKCACDALDNIIIHDDSVYVKKESHDVVGYTGYSLPNDCKPREIVVILTWLLRFQFKTFKTCVGDKGLVRTLGAGWFRKKDLGCCECYTLTGDPIFMLQKTLLSPYRKGPNLESVTLE